ncbi:WW domain-binding protein 2-like [Oppia nitens]|uniref:WW domain-binding protein 2-like n=1 Tax=Oppia nitens TaxID=1686743 RepID=UPI0023DAF387|nr:WW domain-binding protein 2-like [Oppia nitens]XP_054160496.1 WW domain-binding protein 2-like [Oppia nitens]
MATFNSSHHQSGGVVLFAGELILLYVDKVDIQFDNKSLNSVGRLYLTTHRIVFTSGSNNQNMRSFSAPFYAIYDLSLEQPVFGANYIKGKVRPESQIDGQNGVTFKLHFKHGGAIEFGQAMDSAAKQASSVAQNMHFQPPPPYTTTAGQYYEAPPSVYQPAYNCGFALPTQVFSTPPPAGFIYTMEAPPPYPGLNTAPQQCPAYNQMAFPAYGQTLAGDPYQVYQNGNASASAPPLAPQPAGFAFGNERPPTYDEAIKKHQ